jgi:hypothetical protein
MDEGCPWMVVLRAYMICLLCVGQRLDGAAVHFIVLPQARRGNGRPVQRGRRSCAPGIAFTPPIRCEATALTVANNVAIDVGVCGASLGSSSDAVVNIAHQIAAEVLT